MGDGLCGLKFMSCVVIVCEVGCAQFACFVYRHLRDVWSGIVSEGVIGDEAGLLLKLI